MEIVKVIWYIKLNAWCFTLEFIILPRRLVQGPFSIAALERAIETLLAKTVLRQVLDRWQCRFSISVLDSIIEHKIFLWLFVTQVSIFYFQILRRVTCGTLVTRV